MAENEPATEALYEELTSYLDGELDAAAVRRVEERLARDPAYRAELQRLERTWDLLDGLPLATVDESFTKTTIEMVAVAASQDAREIEIARPRMARLRRGAGLLAAGAAGVGGFLLGAALWPDPNQQLLNDLPVLEDFELYYQADNIEFLHQLDRAGLFQDAEGDHAS